MVKSYINEATWLLIYKKYFFISETKVLDSKVVLMVTNTI